MPIDERIIKELHFSASRSGGPGGQNVNKVSSKVELRFHLASSEFLTEEEVLLLSTALKNKINNEGELLIVSQEERSQQLNKIICIEKFLSMLRKALTPKKKRKATKPSKASKEKRIQSKKVKSEIKTNRCKVF